MTHKQHPIGTDFTPASTADDVLVGVDLVGKTAIVTGGHAGIGLEVTRALAKAGARVILGARDPSRASKTIANIRGVEVAQLDLIDPTSIDNFSKRQIESCAAVNMLINCAVACGGPERDVRGYETQFATNHLGHFQLTLALLPLLSASFGARVVSVSSGAHRFGSICWNDLQFERSFNSLAAYAQSKVANVLFAVELDRRWESLNIRGFAVHPGVVATTKLSQAAGYVALKRMELIDEDGHPIIDPAAGKKTPAQAASTIVFAAASPLLIGFGGVYLKDNDISPLVEDGGSFLSNSFPAEAAPHAIDPEAARRLWTLSKALLVANPAPD